MPIEPIVMPKWTSQVKSIAEMDGRAEDRTIEKSKEMADIGATTKIANAVREPRRAARYAGWWRRRARPCRSERCSR